MNSIATECLIRDLELMLGRDSGMHGGACARDLERHPANCITPINNTPTREILLGTAKIDTQTGQIIDEPPLVLETYATGVDGEMQVLRGKEEMPLSFEVPKGYNFQI